MDSSSLCGQAGDNPSHHRHRPTLKRMHACVMYVQVYRTDVLYILDWWSDVCTGFVYYMYWTGVLNWTGVMYVMDWGLVYSMYCCMYWTGVLYEGEGRGEALHLHLY